MNEYWAISPSRLSLTASRPTSPRDSPPWALSTFFSNPLNFFPLTLLNCSCATNKRGLSFFQPPLIFFVRHWWMDHQCGQAARRSIPGSE